MTPTDATATIGIEPRTRHALAAASGAFALALLATALLAVTGVVRAVTAHSGAGGDFLSFYAAGSIVRHGGHGLYDASLQDAVQRALYPGTLDHATGYPLPVFAAWVFAPLSKLPFGAAFLVWGLVNLALLAALAAALARHLAAVPALPRRVFIAAFALSIPAVTDVVFGQVDLFIFAALLGAWLLLRRERMIAAGVVLAAVLLKPQFLLGVVPMLIAWRQWRTLLALAAVGTPLLVVPALITDPHALFDHLALIGRYRAGDDLQVNAALMSNWRGFMVSATGNGSAWLWAPGTLLIAAAAYTVAWRRWTAAPAGQAYALAVMLPLLVSPHLHTQSLVLLFIPLAIFLRDHFAAASPHSRAATRQARAAALLLALYAALFVCWLCTATAFAPGVFLVAAIFAALAYRWPTPESAARAGIDRIEARAA
jgi:hypothetical protein